MEKIKRIIESNKCLKLICGAGNENLKEVEKLAYIFSKCGFNLIDVCAKLEVINAAKSGIKRAGKEDETAICVSIGLQDDTHMIKAVINNQKCTRCKNCIQNCMQDAIYSEDEKIQVDDKKCIGCKQCDNICKEHAIIFEHKYKNPHEMLLPLISENIDCIEYHCSSEDEDRIIDLWNKIKSIYNGQLGICIDRSKFGDTKIIELLKKFNDNTSNLIIQCDGKPMSGGLNDLRSTLQTVAFAELIRSAGLNNFLILSGGTNAKSTYLASVLEVNINGIAVGSYARKLVKEYLSDDFFYNQEKQNAALNKAQLLTDNLAEYL